MCNFLLIYSSWCPKSWFFLIFLNTLPTSSYPPPPQKTKPPPSQNTKPRPPPTSPYPPPTQKTKPPPPRGGGGGGGWELGSGGVGVWCGVGVGRWWCVGGVVFVVWPKKVESPQVTLILCIKSVFRRDCLFPLTLTDNPNPAPTSLG